MTNAFVKWQERYGSAALNQKLAGVIPPGVYQGYHVSPSAAANSVDVAPPASGRSVAVVQRNGFSITVAEESTVVLKVPATNQLYHIVVEAKYRVGEATTSQLKVVPGGNEASHHVIVGSVERSGGALQPPVDTYREDHTVVQDEGGVRSMQVGVSSNRPAPGEKDRVYLESDTGKILHDDGNSWNRFGNFNPSVIDALQVVNAGGVPQIRADTKANRPDAGAPGRLFFTTDTQEIFRDDGSTWTRLAEAPANISPGDLGFDPATQSELEGHTGAENNPHSVDKTQVGLENVTDDEQVVDAGGVPEIKADEIHNRPAADTEGRLFLSTDEPQLYRDTGSTWQKVKDVQRAIKNQLRLSVDTAPAENIQSDRANFVAQVLSVLGVADVTWEYGEEGTGLTETFDPGVTASSVEEVVEPAVEELAGDLDYTLTESGDDVRGAALTDNYIAYGGADDNVYVHDRSDGSLRHTLTESGGIVRSVALTDDYVAYGGADDNVYVHDRLDGSLRHTLAESGADVLGVALTDNYVAYGGGDDNAYVHFNVDVTLLSASTTYEYRAVAESNGETRKGQIQTFTTTGEISEP